MRARGMCLICLLLLLALQLLSSSTPQAKAERVFDPKTDAFFEYGAESGNLDAWDEVGISPGGTWCSHSPASGTKVDDTHVRTGTKSIYMYQHNVPKDNPCRRVTQKWAQNKPDIAPRTELYWSWWVYFGNSIWGTMDTHSNAWTVLGSVGLYWGADDQSHGKWQWQTGVAFYAIGANRRLYLRSGFPSSFAPSGAYNHYDYSSFYVDEDFPDQWVHFQIYYKMSDSGNGEYKGWINDNLIGEASGLTNDPRAYPEWNQHPNTRFAVNEYPRLVVKLYQNRESNENWIWVDDVVASDVKVPENYGVDHPSAEFDSWEDGFESGNFSAWYGIQYDNGGYEPTVTSTYAYRGSSSANLTIDGTINSYSRPMHIVSKVSEVYMSSYVRFEDLPDTNNSVLWFHRIARSDGTFIAAAGVHKVNANYYWLIYHSDSVMNETQAMIKADKWYGVEFYFNATTSGNSMLWVYDDGETKMCEMSGDYNSYGSIGIVCPYIYAGGWNGSQQTSKTLFHDDFAVDDKRIGFGAPTTFQTSTSILTGVEDEPVRFSTLEGVRINGTRSTNASGRYEWANLAYNKVHTFVIEKPAGCYPAWVLNVEGSYSWNGTHYILRHNVTEKQNGPIEICFSPTEEVYIKSSTHKLTSVCYNSSYKNPHAFMRFNIAADIGATSQLEIYTADEGHPRPHKIEGATDWSIDSESNILTVWLLHTSEEETEIEWRGAAMGQ